MGDARTPKDEAADAATHGKLDRAAELYREALRRDPQDAATRQKLAEVLRRGGRTAEAIAAYAAVADRFARDGLPLKAIATSRTILELDPHHVETQASLAALYAGRAARGSGARPAAPSGGAAEQTELVSLAALADAAPETGLQRIQRVAVEAMSAGVEDEDVVALDEANEVTEDEAGEAPAPRSPSPALPRVPIFSDLSPDAFVALACATILRRAREGEAVLREGDTGTSFWVVAAGRLSVSKRDERGEPVVLAHLGEGDFFGEMALLSGAPRAATVEAEAPSELLELGADALLAVAGAHPHLAASLRRFYRQRLLANAMAVSPVFRPFSKSDRKRVVERFRTRAVVEGETVIREGEPSDGLYVVLEGALDVVKRKDAGAVGVGRLREGDVFGEMSCLRKAPASASVVARRAGSLLKLPRRDFDDLVMSYPRILELVAELSDERAESLDAILTGHAQWTEDGLVLI